MPYVPSKKTDGKSMDRILIDEAVEEYSSYLAKKIKTNYDFGEVLKNSFDKLGKIACSLEFMAVETYNTQEAKFFRVILAVGKKYEYEGAFLGELNYGLTRTIQRVPQMLAEQGKCGLVVGNELRYWLYAMVVSALTAAANKYSMASYYGIGGVFEDVKDEYKVRVNKSYEIAQILKSGDCYDTPYFNKIVEIVDEEGIHVGYTYIELKNDGENVLLDKMPYKLVVKNF